MNDYWVLKFNDREIKVPLEISKNAETLEDWLNNHSGFRKSTNPRFWQSISEQLSTKINNYLGR